MDILDRYVCHSLQKAARQPSETESEVKIKTADKLNRFSEE
jgi:hypothetical protein